MTLPIQIAKQFDLRPYQTECISKVLEDLKSLRCVMAILPTGTGKTVTFAEITKLFTMSGMKVLILAHRRELILQAKDKIESHCGITCDIEMGSDKSDRMAQVTVASVQTLARRYKKYSQQHFHLIICDEFHHASRGSQYEKIFNHFTTSKIVGFTATPDRHDGQTLNWICNKVSYQYAMATAIKESYLVPILFKKLTTPIDLKACRVLAGDLAVGDLDYVLNENLSTVISGINTECKDKKTIVFTPTVQTAKLIATALNDTGFKAVALSGDDDDEYRADILKQFKTGAINMLVNCALFTEGFDEPSIEAVVIARPTLSRTLYCQMVGRGTRPSTGKQSLLLVDFNWSTALPLVKEYDLFAASGYGEEVRRKASKYTSPDILFNIEQAHAELYDKTILLTKIARHKADFGVYDPFSIATLGGIDITGEFEIEFMGHTLSGPATEKQVKTIRNCGIKADGLTKSQASRIIGMLAANSWSVRALMNKKGN